MTPTIDGIGVTHPASDRGGYPVAHWRNSTSNKHLSDLRARIIWGRGARVTPSQFCSWSGIAA